MLSAKPLIISPSKVFVNNSTKTGLRLILTVFLSAFLTTILTAQHKPLRNKTITLSNDSIKLDTLSIVPQTFKLIDHKGKEIDSALYSVNYAGALLIPSVSLKKIKTVTAVYSVFPIDFTKEYYHRKYIPESDSLTDEEWYYYSPSAVTSSDPFNLGEFQKSGSISRAVSAGNSQNLSVASDMNLQLAGMISPELKITAVITDNNIPIQPDGNTQQLQDFDNVFIRLDHKNGSLTAGDFIMKRPQSYFLNYRKKSQGVKAGAHFETGKHKGEITAYAGAAISRGNYNRYYFQGIEGNQGPYKLEGANHERYIVILSGTEKVYMDGKLLTRGESNDYVINYNTAEITFMPRITVTKDKRFSIEFEYSVQQYTRAMIAGGAGYKTDKFHIAAHIFSEGDMKSQPIDKALTPEEKSVMEKIGDNLSQAVIPAADSTGFFNDRVMYKMIDSLGYDSVFVYSTNPDSAVYQVSFSLVGQGNGNYVRENTAANGRVFRWIAPVNGVSQGEYAPVRLLITPKKKQMFTTTAGYRFGKNTTIDAEAALSVRDLNTFSSLDATDNNGIATRLRLTDIRKFGSGKQPVQLKTKISYRYVQKNFNAIERFRNVEFNRDWNGLANSVIADEHLTTASLKLLKNKLGSLGYNFENYYKGRNNNGLRNIVNAGIEKKGWLLQAVVNNTATHQSSFSSKFLRHNATIEKTIGIVKIGIHENAENNKYHQTKTETLLPNSYSFNEYGAYLSSADSATVNFRIDYKYRNDCHSDSLTLTNTAESNEFTGEMALLKNAGNILKITGSYRVLRITDTTLTSIRPDESARGRIEHRLRLWKGALRSSVFYEIGSGLEMKKEYSYLQVAPGQGVFSWTDYNGNGVKELDEFEVAAFRDQANYIRIVIPSQEYVKVSGNRFNFNLSLTPSLIWFRSSNAFLKTIARFSNNLIFRSQIKTGSNNIIASLNPFNLNTVDADMIYLNSFFRNTIFFNRNNPVFGLDYTFIHNKNKALMVNGYEGRSRQQNNLKIRWNISRKYLLELTGEQGNKIAFSEFFDTRNFNIDFVGGKTKITLQPGRKYRIALQYEYMEKLNSILPVSSEKAVNNSISVLGKLNNPGKGNITAIVSYINWEYNGKEGNQLAFEMLDGYRTGTNLRWNISYNRTLMKNLQLTIVYDGRQSAKTKTIHTGTIQLRAFF